MMDEADTHADMAATGIIAPVSTLPEPTPRLAGLAGETLAMLRFYSRLPVPALGAFDDPAAPPPFSRACRMLPVASVLISLIPAATVLALGLTALPELFVACAGVAVGLATTGALHEDGLADMVDGFGGGATVARKLEIMKDSRVGSYGAAALVLALIAKVVLLAALVVLSPLLAAGCVVAGAVLSRTLSLGLFALLPDARADGVASAVGRPAASSLIIAGALTLLLTLLAATPGLGIARVVAGVIVALLATAALGRIARRQIGGQTGDVIGAAQVLAEIAFLAGLLLA